MHGWLSSSSLNFSILIIKLYFLKEMIRDIKERAKNWFKWWLTIIKNNNVEKDADGSNAFSKVVDDSSLILSTTTTNKEEKKNVNFKQSLRNIKRRKWWAEKRNFPERYNNNNAAESIHLLHKADGNYFGDNQNLINFDGDRSGLFLLKINFLVKIIFVRRDLNISNKHG
ncbi:unnamed protein product [Meloidogyne enterolobii]|uniref:Uncharacterized protein n=1 Tax=Meloidogyne enterolobii TaxID=390850 RepID=A0ACB1A3W0_MELEN